MKSILDFLKSSDPVIAAKAAAVDSLTKQVGSGQISQAEYTDLLQDAVDISEVETISKEVDRQVELREAFNFLSDYGLSFLKLI